jgi:GH15 family glucan-1,4-alpha-glucosidase
LKYKRDASPTIADYGLISDMRTAALISRQGSLDWLCWPDFDSQACFASLLGSPANGRWLLSPTGKASSKRCYVASTNVLESTHSQGSGNEVTVTDFMPIHTRTSALVRIVRGVTGKVSMRSLLSPRFDYGSAQPRIVQKESDCWNAVVGPHRLTLHSNVPLVLEGGDLVATWKVHPGEAYFFSLQHSNSYLDEQPEPLSPIAAQWETEQFWRNWAGQNRYRGPYRDHVERSLLTLKALTYAPSGGFVASPTTSLPEKVGGVRNWDYRFCWLRDTTFSLLGLEHCGYHEDARAWLEWLSRSLQGSPDSLKIMYGITGKREHSEWVAEWLDGYQNSKPVHIGNKASGQLQLDTFGEVLDALYRARRYGLYPHEDKSGQALELPLLEHLEKVWTRPDAGFWEFRTEGQQFTESNVMAWVAFDRGIRIAEEFGVEAPVERWRSLRKKIHAQVCSRGFHRGLNSFTQAYGNKHLDASLLLLPIVGFLPIEDSRIQGTIKAIEKHLFRNGLLLRYDTAKVKDGLPAGEGAFLACSFWLVDVYVLQGRMEEAHTLFQRLINLSSGLGLLSEEYDAKYGLIGNYPQALTHIGLINAALSLEAGTSVRLHELEQDIAVRTADD